MDSYGKKPEAYECGAFYGQVSPKMIASKPAGQWQTVDIFFRTPWFDAKGEIVERGRAAMYQTVS